ncbi:MbcA/ParS/Xre antitoxin family protein [Colwellia sp. D2M02]|uniref:MbcA/ParS/Xre antitoxin family protein n=1 Tax=Colwellia sp. D2M02 TaxID=2841562 RepID=UPI001C092CCD|nr:MbcA/ParS/Xre antitoxin family protein [Colwellia sp. D2M02]MBU2894962.1 MbcA/ParS/Xre antitoxin family protein [Colwellia sp. D2M02]
MKNKLTSQVKEIEGKLLLELPSQVIEKLSVSQGDNVEFGIGKQVNLWKSHNTDVPDDIYERVLDIVKTDELASKWLSTKRAFFLGKAAIELISTDEGKDKVFELLDRLAMGDIS